MNNLKTSNAKLAQGALILFALFILSACGGSGGSPQAGPDSDPGLSPEPQAVSVTLRSGLNFDCFTLNDTEGALFCRNEVPLGVNRSVNFGPGGPGCSGDGSSCTGTGGSFIRVVASGAAITSLAVWDETICWTTQVSERPLSGDAGPSTYCIGEAFLQNYGGFPMVYSGPSYAHAVHGSPDLSYAQTPFAAGEISMSDLLTAGMIADGSGSVSSQVLSCSLLGTTLTCPSFTVDVQ